MQRRLDGPALPRLRRSVRLRIEFDAPGQFRGVDEADTICNDEAVAAGLPGVYKAWLADQTAASAPASSFFQATGPYVMPDGTQVADDWADLTDGSLDNFITVTADGGSAEGEVWTNVLSDGTQKGAAAADSCDGWTNIGAGTQLGRVGVTNVGDSGWTDSGTFTCEAPILLYCFGQ